jgi:hypothetical protein
MVYQEKWRANNTVTQIRQNLPPISEYLLSA